MNTTNIFIIIGIVAIVALGAWWLVSGTDAPDVAMSETTELDPSTPREAVADSQTTESSPSAPLERAEEAPLASAGTYEKYSPEKLQRANDGDVVLFFKASWCTTCRALEANILKNKEDIPAGVSILEVDYDRETDLKRKYGVTYQHTLVQVDSQGTMITKWMGSPTLSSLLNKIQ